MVHTTAHDAKKNGKAIEFIVVSCIPPSPSLKSRLSPVVVTLSRVVGGLGGIDVVSVDFFKVVGSFALVFGSF